MIARLLAWVRGIITRRRVERESAAELQFHIDAETDANIARGMTREDARRAALRDLGGVTQIRESVRDVRRLAPETWLRDGWYAIRGLRRSPGFSTLAIVVLGLGIGLNVTVFSVFNAIFLRSFHVPREHELVFVRGSGGIVIQALQEQSRDLFSASAGFGDFTSLVEVNGVVEELDGEVVSAGYFETVDVSVARGRGFEPGEDDHQDVRRSVVISHAWWQRRFGGSPDAIGAPVVIDDQTFRVVGVARLKYAGLSNIGEPTAFWVTKAHLVGALARHTGLDVLPQTASQIVARLRPGVTREQAERLLNARAEAIAARGRDLGVRTVPSRQQSSYRVTTAAGTVAPLEPSADLGPVRALVAAAGVIVVLVLTIAATNLAGLLMARGVVRRHEIAIRRALGAGLGRIVRQLLSESAVLGCAAAAAGLAVAWIALALYRVYSPARFLIDIPVDARVVLFGVTVGMLAGLLLGVLPARQAATVDVLGALDGGERAGTHRRSRQRLSRFILVPQLALSVGLLVVAGAQMRGLVAAETSQLGVNATGVALIRTRAEVTARDPSRLRAQIVDHGERTVANRARYLRLLEVVRAEPGVASAALASMVPISVSSSERMLASRGSTTRAGRAALVYARPAVSDGLFAALGITLLRGRDFGSTENIGSIPVAIVSDSLARALWPGGDAIGGVVAWADGNGEPQPNAVWYEVVGVVSDTRPPIPTDGPTPAIYMSAAQLDSSFTPFTLVIKGQAGVADARLLSQVRRAVAVADPDMRLLETRTLDEKIAEDLFPRRAIAGIVASCGSAGLLLAAVGLYGVISFAIARRRRDFGIRVTLGARPRDLVTLVLRDGLRLTLLGVPPGLLLGAFGLRLTMHLAGPIQGFDWGSLVAAALVICVVIFLACFLPARRAARVDAMQALRES